MTGRGESPDLHAANQRSSVRFSGSLFLLTSSIREKSNGFFLDPAHSIDPLGFPVQYGKQEINFRADHVQPIQCTPF
jgi:hypothetical protein